MAVDRDVNSLANFAKSESEAKFSLSLCDFPKLSLSFSIIWSLFSLSLRAKLERNSLNLSFFRFFAFAQSEIRAIFDYSVALFSLIFQIIKDNKVMTFDNFS